MSYISLYGLEEANTFVRTTLRRPGFCKNWLTLVKAGLTDDQLQVESGGLLLRDWSKPVLAHLNEGQADVLGFLGLFEDQPVPSSAKTSADILQWLLETRLAMKPEDRDMIVMKHELECTNGKKTILFDSRLVVKGEDATRTAMAKTVGLPLGIAASLMLRGKLHLPGVQVPTHPEIYLPVLAELEANDIRFTESERELVS
jgi:saccharopine dehydrogenase (NADP+, L-glutamate forming)